MVLPTFKEIQNILFTNLSWSLCLFYLQIWLTFKIFKESLHRPKESRSLGFPPQGNGQLFNLRKECREWWWGWCCISWVGWCWRRLGDVLKKVWSPRSFWIKAPSYHTPLRNSHQRESFKGQRSADVELNFDRKERNGGNPMQPCHSPHNVLFLLLDI